MTWRFIDRLCDSILFMTNRTDISRIIFTWIDLGHSIVEWDNETESHDKKREHGTTGSDSVILLLLK